MKWIFPVLILFCAIFLIVGSVFVLNLDSDPFRAELQSSLQSVFNHKVELGPLSIRWQGIRPFLYCEEMVVKNASTEEVLVRSKNLRAALKLSSFWNRPLKLKSLLFDEARFTVVRDETGFWNWDFHSEKSLLNSNLPGPPIALPGFEILNASLYYADRSQLPYFHQELHSVKMQVSEPEPSSLHIKLIPQTAAPSFFPTLNLSLKGRHQLSITGDFGSGGQGSLLIDQPFGEARFQGELILEKVDLARIPFVEFMEGTAAAIKFEASGEGLHPENLKRTLILKGVVETTEGKWLGRNFVQETLEAMAPLPGFVNLTRTPFVGNYYDFSHSKDTAFQKLKFQLQCAEGKVFIENLEVLHPFYKILGDGSLNLLQQQVDFKGTIFFVEPFASHLVSRVRDMDVLFNPGGDLQVPFSYQGRSEDARVAPNLFYIAHRLIQIRGEELASRGIQKINEFLEAYQS